MSNLIEGVLLLERLRHEDARGRVLRMLRCDDAEFAGFGEVYFSTVRQAAVKAWKLHRRMVLNLAVPMGSVLFTIYDPRPNSSTKGQVQTEVLGANHYRLLQLPPGLWFGFQGMASGESLVANCASIPHDPQESISRPANSPEIPYRWSFPA